MRTDRLGNILRKRRDEIGLSLRQVEEKTGISNAYLSQLENHKIAKPSPLVLKKLADFYGLSYIRLMQLAGYPPISKKAHAIVFRTSSGLEEITPEEEKELLEYLKFIRMRRLEK